MVIDMQGYAGYMVDCTRQMLKSLHESGQTELEIGEYMSRLTADIISRTEFDCSYEKGQQIFHLLTVLQRLCAQSSRHLCFPGSRWVVYVFSSIRESKLETLDFSKFNFFTRKRHPFWRISQSLINVLFLSIVALLTKKLNYGFVLFDLT